MRVRCKTLPPISGLALADHLMEYDGQLWVGPVLTDDHTVKGKKTTNWKQLKEEGRKSNLLHVRESLALDIKTKGAKKKKKSLERISKKFAKCIEHTKK